MIDKFVYWMFSKIDDLAHKVDDVLTLDFPNCKKKMAKIKGFLNKEPRANISQNVYPGRNQKKIK